MISQLDEARTERGAVASEYALLVAGIALVMAIGAAVFGEQVLGLFDGVGLPW